MACRLRHDHLVAIANEFLLRVAPGCPTLDPRNEYDLYRRLGILEQLHDEGKLTDDEYLAWLGLFEPSSYPGVVSC